MLSGPKIRRFGDQWYLWYIAGRKWKVDGGRRSRSTRSALATSDDGIHWTPMNRDLIESRIEEDEAQASPDVFYAGGRYHMFFCYRGSRDYRGKANGYRIGYASSTDLVRLVARRREGRASTSRTQGWDAEMVSYPHVFERRRPHVPGISRRPGRAIRLRAGRLDGTLG